jgi:hypothetical protein
LLCVFAPLRLSERLRTSKSKRIIAKINDVHQNKNQRFEERY